MPRKITHEDFINEANAVPNHQGKGFIYLDKYEKMRKRIRILCPRHGIFTQTPHNHLAGRGCSECKKDKLHDTKNRGLAEFIRIASNVEEHIGKEYDYSKFVYYNSITAGIIICQKHGEFLQKPVHHLQGYGCQTCASSKGEIKVKKFLDEHNIAFIRSHKFTDCRNVRPLPFDFYLPEYNIVIEFQGKQHYEQAWGGSKESLLLRQHRDDIKRGYCLKHNVRLIEIRYDEDVGRVLTDKLV